MEKKMKQETLEQRIQKCLQKLVDLKLKAVLEADNHSAQTLTHVQDDIVEMIEKELQENGDPSDPPKNQEMSSLRTINEWASIIEADI